MPKTTVIKQLISSTRPIIASCSTDPRHNAAVVMEEIYKKIIGLNDTVCPPHGTDYEILFFLDHYRYPRRGDSDNDLLCFDFTLTDSSSGAAMDMASFALTLKHIKTLHLLLQGEQLTWENQEQVRCGLTRALEPDGYTWLHKSMILASLVHERYKDSPSFHLPLKEFLQHSMQVYVNLLRSKFSEAEQVNILRSIATLFIQKFQAGAISIIPLVFPMQILKCALEEADYRALLTALCFDKQEEIEQITTTYGLTPNELRSRYKQRTEIGANSDPIQFEADKTYLKTCFRLSISMADKALFRQSIGNASDLAMGALLESIYDIFNSKESFSTPYFLSSLAPNIRKKTLDYLFLTHSNSFMSSYMPSCDIHTQEMNFKIFSMFFYTGIDTLGNIIYQYTYLQALIQAAVTYKSGNLFDTFIAMFEGLVSPLSGARKILISKDDAGKHGPYPAMNKYPLLIKNFVRKYHAFQTAIIASLEDGEANGNHRRLAWFAYLSLMNISLISESCTLNAELMDQLRLSFQIREYWFDQLIANKSKYPSLWARMRAYLIETNFFCNPTLKTLLNYKFGELSDTGLALQNARLAIGPGLSNNKLTRQYSKKITEFFTSSKDGPLVSELGAQLRSQKVLIDEQLNFVESWVLLAESYERKGGGKGAQPKASKSSRLMIYALIKQTPLGEVLLSGSDTALSLVLDKFKLSGSELEALTKTLVFDEYASEMFFVLLLFLKTSDTPAIYNQMLLLLEWINFVCEKSPSIKHQYEPFYEVMCKYNFFQDQLGTLLIKIFYLDNLFDLPPAEQLLKAPDLDAKEAPCEKKPRRKKKKAPTDSDGPAESCEAHILEVAEAVSDIALMVVPEMQHKDVQPPGQEPLMPVNLLSEEASERADSSSDGGSMDTPAESTESAETILKKTALRKAQQQLWLVFKYLTAWGHAKIAHHSDQSIQAIQYNALIRILDANQDCLRKIRSHVKKYPADPSLPSEPNVSLSSPLWHLEYYEQLVRQIIELATEIPDAEQILPLAKDIVIISQDKLTQLQLLEHLMLPAMPIVNKIVALLREHAKISISGTSLFLSKPMDIDLYLEIKNKALSIEDARDLIISIMTRASTEQGLGFEITFNKLLHGEAVEIASVTIRAKGDGYGLHDHKSIDFTLQVKYAPKPHYTSHSAASLDVETGEIDCTPDIANTIIKQIFSIHPATLDDRPRERFQMKVHVLTTVMRAWAESQLRPLRLDESVVSCIESIKKYKGDRATLQKEDPSLDETLMGMITRHFKHFESNTTYLYRTSMLIAFLNELGMTPLIASGIARVLPTIVSNEFEQFNDSASILSKTECYLRFCAVHPLIRFYPKESLIQLLTWHFNDHTDSLNYLHKTQALLNLCNRLGFQVVVRSKLDAENVCCALVSVNFSDMFMVFSPPLGSAELPSFLIIIAPRLLESNKRTMMTTGMNRILSIPRAPMIPSLEAGVAAAPAEGTFSAAGSRHAFFVPADVARAGDGSPALGVRKGL